jgi:hypothetical protein
MEVRMKVAGTEIKPPEYVMLDRRDLNSIRERLAFLEDKQRAQENQMALLMQGVKERLNVFGVLLTRLETIVAGEKLG